MQPVILMSGIDHGSDGSIDQTVQLVSQIPKVYLPLVLR